MPELVYKALVDRPHCSTMQGMPLYAATAMADFASSERSALHAMQTQLQAELRVVPTRVRSQMRPR
jgi:hypothetical protein